LIAMAGSASIPVSRDELRERIRAAGLRSTAPRVAVLACLEGADSPRSHAEICEALQGEGFDRATLYRNLIDLADAGLLTRRDLGDHVWRFERKREGAAHEGEHPHFTCTDCGEVSCLPEVTVRIKAAEGVPKAIAASSVQVQLRGRCDDCA
jgi:Fur family transcriptional regulator, ferric uptake regulator